MSGLYNVIFGLCPLAPQLMSILDLVNFEHNKFTAPRFRDAYPVLEEGEWVIHVLTRVGGDSRDEYQGGIRQLQSHELFKRDYDESYDKSYATFVFSTPDDMQVEMKKKLKPEMSTLPFKERWEHALALIAAKKQSKDAEA
jgi:hypothetical protein